MQTHTGVVTLGWKLPRSRTSASTEVAFETGSRPSRKVDTRLPGKGNSNSHGARPVHLIITMIKWIRTSRLSMKNSLSDLGVEVAALAHLDQHGLRHADAFWGETLCLRDVRRMSARRAECLRDVRLGTNPMSARRAARRSRRQTTWLRTCRRIRGR